MMQIRPKQIKIIKMAQRSLGLDDATYRDILRNSYGVDSCTGLSADQANALIDRFQGQGFKFEPKKPNRPWKQRPQGNWGGGKPRPVGKPRSQGKITALASAGEIEKINAVASLVEWRFEDGLQRFLESRMGIKGGKVRTADEAYRAIEGLKKMFENAMKKAYGQDWWSLPFDEPVEVYIREHAPAEYRDAFSGKVYKQAECPA